MWTLILVTLFGNYQTETTDLYTFHTYLECYSNVKTITLNGLEPNQSVHCVNYKNFPLE